MRKVFKQKPIKDPRNCRKMQLLCFKSKSLKLTLGAYISRSIATMQRNIPWGLAAFYPILGIAYVSIGDTSDPYFTPLLIPPTQFWISYWWIVLGTSFIVPIFVFLLHALMNQRLSSFKRIIWAIAIFGFGFFVTPIYWWFYSEPKQLP